MSSILTLLAGVLFACALLAPPVSALTEFDFEQRYFFEPETYLKDHTLIEHEGRFHLFYIVGELGGGWNLPGNEIDFGHASSADLIHWDIHDRVLSIDEATWKNRNVWAPHVVASGGDFIMAYTGIDSTITQRIGIARSDDLFDWVDFSVESAAYSPDTTWALWQPGTWSNCRDPFLRWESGQWMMLNTASARPEYAGANRGALSLAFSADGLEWTDAGDPLALNNNASVLESPFIYTHDTTHYLFFNEAGVAGLQYATSDSLLSGWDVTQGTGVIDEKGFAAEVLDTAGHTWFSRVRAVFMPDSVIVRGALFDTLLFEDDRPLTGNPNNLWNNWTQLPGGTAFNYQPTFEDRPFGRTGIPSNIEGHFWINTGEIYSEPVGVGCPECPPQDFRFGILRSRTFAVAGDSLELRVGGTMDPDSTYVALRRASDEMILFSETGTGNEVMTRRIWDLEGLQGTVVFVEIADISVTGHISVDAIRELDPDTVGLEHSAAPPERRFSLRAAPNPAHLPTIRYELTESSPVRLAVFDVRGRHVRMLVDDIEEPGQRRRQWDGRLETGAQAPSGVYFVRLEAGGYSQTARVVRIR